MSDYNLNGRRNGKGGIEIDLGVLAADLRKCLSKYWWLFLVLCHLLAGGSIVLEVRDYQPLYRASASFSVTLGSGYQEENASESSYNYSAATSERLSEVFPSILDSSALKELIAEDLGAGYINGGIGMESVQNSNLFTLQVISPNAEDAKNILDSVIEHFPEVSRYVIGNTHFNIIQPSAIPAEPFNSLNYVQAAITGAGMGAVLSLCLMLLYALCRKTMHTEGEIKKTLNIRLLGSLPFVTFKKHKNESGREVWIHNPKVGGSFAEAVRSLALRLEHVLEQDQKILTVTSTLPEEGKSTVAWNAAEMLAQMNKKVLLIEGDLRRPSLSKFLHTGKWGIGLADVLRGDIKPEEAIQKSKTEGLYFMQAGRRSEEAVNLLGQRGFFMLLKELGREMDYIIIDTPPCGMMTDPIVISRYSDAVLYVVKQDTAKQGQIIDAVQNLASYGISICGVVFNGVRHRQSGYGYHYHGHYGYGKYGSGRYGRE